MSARSDVRLGRRDRVAALTSLILVVGLAWLYLWREASRMSATMPMNLAGGEAPAWSVGAFVLTLLMWIVMMIGMMLPSAAPATLLYGRIAGGRSASGSVSTSMLSFAGAYVVVWAVYSLAVSALQLELRSRGSLTTDMSSASVWLSSAVLIVAGVYQWTALKHACLARCRSPLGLFLMRWRAGRLGAFRMGLEHGIHCVGCCWALMLLLFVAGVMSLVWVAVIAGFVLVEKLLPHGRLVSRAAGAALVAAGLALPIAS